MPIGGNKQMKPGMGQIRLEWSRKTNNTGISRDKSGQLTLKMTNNAGMMPALIVGVTIAKAAFLTAVAGYDVTWALSRRIATQPCTCNP
jgi:hypothetical protein